MSRFYYTQGVDEGIKLYVDGKLKSEMPSAGAAPENWYERRIGSEHDGRWLNGMVDEVRASLQYLQRKLLDFN